MAHTFSIRRALPEDAEALHQLEQQCFDSDRLSLRRIKHWTRADNCLFMVAESKQQMYGYALTLLHRGTRLARLYSVAVSSDARGSGLGKRLIETVEIAAAECGRLFMRLEVAQDNLAAIHLYQHMGYAAFGTYEDYYEDHRDALRMQKCIRRIADQLISRPMPWYQQTTDFSCGPASLMMGMAGLDKQYIPDQLEELEIWREATTIFMTSGHGGCHPIGLALAAHKRGFHSEVYLNQRGPPFIESVRNQHKKDIMTTVHRQFVTKARQATIGIHYKDISQRNIERWLHEGASVIILISTYRMDGKKTPHWVAVSGIDDLCLYVHDPDPVENKQSALDCQHMPIARSDFEKMSLFGRERLRTAVLIRPIPPDDD